MVKVFCVSPEDQRGKGRCTHIAHQKEGQSVSDFIGEIENFKNSDEIKIKTLEEIKRGLPLSDAEIQTPEICLEAVKQNAWALEYVKNQTPEICLEAIKQDALALKYVQNQTPEIIEAALSQDPDVIEFVEI